MPIAPRQLHIFQPYRRLLIIISGRSSPRSLPAVQARAEEGPSGVMPPELAQKLEDKNKELSKKRRKRAISPSVATPEALADFTQLVAQPLHKTSKVTAAQLTAFLSRSTLVFGRSRCRRSVRPHPNSTSLCIQPRSGQIMHLLSAAMTGEVLVQAGILAIAVSPDSDGVVATAGADATVQVLDRGEGRVLASLQGHTKKVNGALLPAVSQGHCTPGCPEQLSSRRHRKQSLQQQASVRWLVFREHHLQQLASIMDLGLEELWRCTQQFGLQQHSRRISWGCACRREVPGQPGAAGDGERGPDRTHLEGGGGRRLHSGRRIEGAHRRGDHPSVWPRLYVAGCVYRVAIMRSFS